jgi:uncharacterized membrane protein
MARNIPKSLARPTLFMWMAGASAVGLAAAFWQLMEKLAILKNKDVVLSCNFNDVFSCSNVLNAHQSSVFGPPNSVIGIIMFTFFLSMGIVGLTGSKLAKKLALVVQGLALFMFGFTLWFLFQSTYRIQSICIFCLFIGTAVLIINAAILRHNAGFSKKLQQLTKRGADLFGWAVVWLVVAFAMLLKFG